MDGKALGRRVEKMGCCKPPIFCQGLVRAIAVVGFSQAVELFIYVLPMPLIAANADPFPDDTRVFFTVGTGMCSPGTGLACPRPDLPIMRRNDLDKFSGTPQIAHEQSPAAGGC